MSRRVAALIQNASHRALGECDAEAFCDLGLDIGAAPANHAVQRWVRRRLNDLVEFGELVFAQKRRAPALRPVAKPINTLCVTAVNPVTQGLPVRASVSGGVAARGTVQDRSQRQKPPRLVGVANASRLAPQFLGRELRTCNANGHRSHPPSESSASGNHSAAAV